MVVVPDFPVMVIFFFFKKKVSRRSPEYYTGPASQIRRLTVLLRVEVLITRQKWNDGI